jgi:hypothetical protein
VPSQRPEAKVQALIGVAACLVGGERMGGGGMICTVMEAGKSMWGGSGCLAALRPTCHFVLNHSNHEPGLNSAVPTPPLSMCITPQAIDLLLNR